MTEPVMHPAADRPIRVLIVDDDRGLRDLVRDFLQNQAFEVLEADGAKAMRAALSNAIVDIIVLDVMMPGEDGLSLARELAVTSQAGIIMVSALGQETDRIIGLEAGADDYLPKPFSPRELLARIRAILRRRAGETSRKESGELLFDGWLCDPSRHLLRDPGGVVVPLSHGEFSLLQVFLERPQRVLSRDMLLDLTRGDASEAFDRAVDTQISRLRRKLASRTGEDLIRTVRHEGYQFLPRVERR